LSIEDTKNVAIAILDAPNFFFEEEKWLHCIMLFDRGMDGYFRMAVSWIYYFLG